MDDFLPCKSSLSFNTQNSSYVRQLEAVCSPSQQLLSLLRLDLRCHLPGVCRRIYSGSLLTGVSGRLTLLQVARFRSCFGEGIAYIEEDLKVYKAEGPDSSSRRLLAAAAAPAPEPKVTGSVLAHSSHGFMNEQSRKGITPSNLRVARAQ